MQSVYTSLGVVNEGRNRYASIEVAPEDVDDSDDLLDDVDFDPPYTIAGEASIYNPAEKSEHSTVALNPDRDVIIYDSYGPHGIHRPTERFSHTRAVARWIDRHLEPVADGEYVIGTVLDVDTHLGRTFSWTSISDTLSVTSDDSKLYVRRLDDGFKTIALPLADREMFCEALRDPHGTMESRLVRANTNTNNSVTLSARHTDKPGHEYGEAGRLTLTALEVATLHTYLSNHA